MKTYSPAVTEPFHENRDRMTTEQKGKFCSAGKKPVIDFSNMNDRQLAGYFFRKRRNRGGRFHAGPLQGQTAVPSASVPWMRPLVLLAIPALAVFLEACSPELLPTGPLRVENLMPLASSSATEKNSLAVHPALPFSDTIQPVAKERAVQVVTKKNKTLHPAFTPVDTLRLPQTDTATKPEQAVDILPEPLLRPKKEALVMGRVLHTVK